MKMRVAVAILCASILAGCDARPQTAEDWIHAVDRTTGGRQALLDRVDVEYTYTYGFPAENAIDVSVERYVFLGEWSYARYSRLDARPNPDITLPLVQGYDGNETWATMDGEPIDDPALLRRADFLRKTNFYWFAMMHKLADPGLTYKLLPPRTVGATIYTIVELGFETGVGDVQDTYVLYINPETKLVDRFLFTVLDFDRREPLLMVVDYETVDGVPLPARRRYTGSNWAGEVLGDRWTHEIMTDIKFRNGFERSIFEAPTAIRREE